MLVREVLSDRYRRTQEQIQYHRVWILLTYWACTLHYQKSNCFFAVARTKCEREQKIAHSKSFMINRRYPIVPRGAFMPQCEKNGEFKMTQCHASTGYCWCVNASGAEMRDTRRRFQKPECARSKHCCNLMFSSDLYFDSWLCTLWHTLLIFTTSLVSSSHIYAFVYVLCNYM